MGPPVDTVEVFLQVGQVVADALADPAVADAWDGPSILEDQRVSGLAGHLARGGVWIVAEYLDGGAPAGPVDFTSAGEYFAAFVSRASAEDHLAIRARGVEVAEAGRPEVLRAVGAHLHILGPRLRALEMSHLVAVTGGKVMRIDDYLATRIVEQVVHLDDLARSVDHDPWDVPAAANDIAVAVAVDIARRRAGAPALVRALYRPGFAGSLLPVL